MIGRNICFAPSILTKKCVFSWTFFGCPEIYTKKGTDKTHTVNPWLSALFE